jgi:hypothetical protein
MVFPVYGYTFKVGAPVTTGTPTLYTVKDVNSLEPKIKSTVKNWTPLDQDGWERNLITGKSMSFDFKGQRNYEDPGNDFVAGKLLSTGNDSAAVLEINFPNGDIMTCNGIIDLTAPFGGASTDIDTLEWTYTLDGKPVYTPASAAAPLSLVSNSPAANAMGVADNVSPVLTFNNSLADYAGISFIKATDGSLVTFTASPDSSGKVLTLSATGLEAAASYEIILAGVTDIYSQVLATQIIQFTTA